MMFPLRLSPSLRSRKPGLPHQIPKLLVGQLERRHEGRSALFRSRRAVLVVLEVRSRVPIAVLRQLVGFVFRGFFGGVEMCVFALVESVEVVECGELGPDSGDSCMWC